MIHVQIASDITTVGVEGIRWVLVEASGGDRPAELPPTSPAPIALQAAAAPPPARGNLWSVRRWQLAIIGLGLLAALGLARGQLGLPKLPWLAAPAAPLPLAAPPVPVAPLSVPPIDAAGASPAPALPDAQAPAEPPVSDGSAPALPTPAASATLAERLITAGLR